MKFLATLQMILLLATCVVPEGRHLLSKGAGCSNGCGCSRESRAAGDCCCSKKADIRKASAGKAEGCSNCKIAASKKPAAPETCDNCPTSERERSCCVSHQSTCCTAAAPPEHAGAQISSCPCGNEVWELQVIMMPRVKAARIQVCNGPALAVVCAVQDNQPMGQRPQPESPPPRNLPC